MPTQDGKLGVGICGVGWCASQHIAAFQRNPHTTVTWLCARDADRARANLAKYGAALPDAHITTRYDDLLSSPDVDVISITTPNHLHAGEAVAAARAKADAVTCSPPGATRSTRFAGARASNRFKWARSIRISPPVTSGRPRSSRT